MKKKNVLVNNDNNENERKELQKIIAISKNIRQKYKMLKRGHAESEAQLQETFKPIVEPLKEIAKNTNESDLPLLKQKKTNNKKITPISQTFENIYTPVRSSLLPKKLPQQKLKFEEDDDNESANFNYTPFLDTSVVAEQEREISPRSQIKSFLSTPEGSLEYENLKQNFGNIAADYIIQYATADDSSRDTTYGIRQDSDNKFRIGNSEVTINHNDLNIGDKWYTGSKGLYELLFKKNPIVTNFNADDEKTYLSIILQTNAHRMGYHPNGRLKGSSNWKYINIIKPFVTTAKKKNVKLLHSLTEPRPSTSSGYGIIPTQNQKHIYITEPIGNGLSPYMTYSHGKHNYVYWDDPNELVERLQLIYASKKAGHSNHNNEINSIIEELKESNIIE